MDSTKKKPLSRPQLRRVAELFRALADPLRLAILQTVCQHPCCVGEIVLQVGTTQANVSKHLRKLVERGVLRPQTNGRNVYYALAHGLPLRLCELVHSELASLPRPRASRTPKRAAGSPSAPPSRSRTG